MERVGSFHSHKTLATDVGKADTKRYRTAKLWMQYAEVVERKDTLRKFVSRENIPHTHWRFHKLPPALQGQGPVNPSALMMRDSQYTQSVSQCGGQCPPCNKHLIKFPIALDYSTLRGRNKMEYPTGSTGCSNCSTMHSSQQSVFAQGRYRG